MIHYSMHNEAILYHHHLLETLPSGDVAEMETVESLRQDSGITAKQFLRASCMFRTCILTTVPIKLLILTF
jgi:hypothetical protein